MTDYLIVLLFFIVFWAFVVGIAAFFYRWSLFTKSMAAYFLCNLAVVYACFVAGKVGVSFTNIAIITPAAAAVAIPTVIILFRFTKNSFEAPIDRLIESTVQIHDASRSASMRASEQATTMSEIYTTVDEITTTGRGAAENAQKVLKVAKDAVDRGRSGLIAVQEATRFIEEIGRIQEIIQSVRDLADQSNLLSINARIQAAKAKEKGLGFSVVATEVRNLSSRSKESTRKIDEAILRTEAGEKAIDSIRRLIEGLAEALDSTSEKARVISSAVVQQSAGVQQINDALRELLKTSTINASIVGQLDEAVEQIKETAIDLRSVVFGKVKSLPGAHDEVRASNEGRAT